MIAAEVLTGVDSRLARLYAKVPTFECIAGCTDCCGPIPFSRTEWARVRDKRKATCSVCPYSLGGCCEIYTERPFVCRLFGTVENLRCPHGRGPEQLLTAEEGRALVWEYHAIMRDDHDCR